MAPASDPTFRPATLHDAAALAVLVDIAGEGMPNWMWRGMTGPGRSALEVGRERARREEGGFSYRHATLAEVDGMIASCLIGYRLGDPYGLSDLGEMPPHVQPLVRLEAKAPGTWYVNVLATYPEFRGRGLGTKLLDVASDKEHESGAKAGSIIVGSWNEGACRLYDRAGYRTIATERAVLPDEFTQSGDWILMVRALK